MTNITNKQDNLTLLHEIRDVCGSIGEAWHRVSALSLKVFKHCLEHDHSADLMATMFFHLERANHPTLLKAYSIASFECCAVKYAIDPDTNRLVGKKNKTKWADIKDKDSEKSLALLADKGIRSFLPEKSTAKVKKGVQDTTGILVRNIQEALATLDRDGTPAVKQHVIELRAKLTALYNEVLSFSKDVNPALGAKLMKDEVHVLEQVAKERVSSGMMGSLSKVA